MKVLLLFLFVITAPVAILLATILHGGFSVTTLEQELGKTGVYQKISDTITQTANGDGASDPTTDAIFSVIKDRLTPDYFQLKVNSAINDSSQWITGKSTITPSISFKDLKDEVVAKNPGLLESLNEMATAAQQTPENQTSDSADSSTANNAASSPSPAQMINSISKNNFTFPLTKELIGVKKLYGTLSIAFPVLLGLLVLYAGGILFFSKTWIGRFRWIGVTFILAAIWGFLLLLVFQLFYHILLAIFTQNDNAVVKILYPIIENITTIFVSKQSSNQILMTSILAALGVISFTVSFFVGGNTPAIKTPTAKATRKKSLSK